MTHNTFYPVRVGDQIIWLTNYRNKLPLFAAALALAAGAVSAAQADCDWLIYVLGTLLPSVNVARTKSH